jgi:hypothetical protein
VQAAERPGVSERADGTRTMAEIEQACSSGYSDVFPSTRDVQKFVREVL